MRKTGTSLSDARFMVDLVGWLETIEGDTFEARSATVRLPSKLTGAMQ
jgi:hypothetical protein